MWSKIKNKKKYCYSCRLTHHKKPWQIRDYEQRKKEYKSKKMNKKRNREIWKKGMQFFILNIIGGFLTLQGIILKGLFYKKEK